MIFLCTQSYTTITTINIRTFSLPQKETLYLLAVTPISPQPSSLRLHQCIFCCMNLLFLDISYKYSHVTCDLSLSIMFERFIYVITCVIFHSFLLLNNSPLYGYTTFYLSNHQLMNIYVVSHFWLLRIMLLWTFTHKVLGGHMFSFLLGLYLRVKLLGQTITLCLTSWRTC